MPANVQCSTKHSGVTAVKRYFNSRAEVKVQDSHPYRGTDSTVGNKELYLHFIGYTGFSNHLHAIQRFLGKCLTCFDVLLERVNL